ncbi:MAG: asparagine synthetase B family protein [Gemmatimonadaceae bacterium]
MLAFGALIDLSLAPLDPALVVRLQRSLPQIAGRVSMVSSGETALAHLADERPLPFDADVPLHVGDLLVAGTLRLDGREALRRALAAAAPSAVDDASDVRLVALAYRAWGARLAEHLIGDYAFVVWDRAQRRLVCARDPHGNRTLYWGRAGSRVIVGSAIETVRALPGVSSVQDERSLVELLRVGWVLAPGRTVFRDVHRLSAAHTLCVEGDAAPREQRHWEFPVPTPVRYRRDDDYVAHFREVLDAAVRDRLRATGAGILLSGGMDSPTLAATARRVAPRAALRAFTFTHPTLAPSDDDTLAVAVARRLQLPQSVLDLDEPAALAHLEEASSLPEEPSDESDLTADRACARAAAAHAPIALFGEDGDTLLHPPTLLGQLRTQPAGEVLGSWLRYLVRTGRRPWVGLEWRERLGRRRTDGAPRIAPWMTRRADRLAPAEELPPSSHPLRPRSVRLLSSPQWDSLYVSLSPVTTLAPVLFTFPLVDPRVLAFAFAIPPVPWCQDKYLLRRAMRDELPDAVLTRPKSPLSGYLEARVAQWRARGGAEAPISERVSPWVDVPAVRQTLRAGAPYDVVDAWRVLQVDRWLAREERRRA